MLEHGMGDENHEAGHSDECRLRMEMILRKDNGLKQPTGGVTNTVHGHLRGEWNRK